ncbi:MAG: cupredoxin family copper-binding protein [Patescibacteria group bacterium]
MNKKLIIIIAVIVAVIILGMFYFIKPPSGIQYQQNNNINNPPSKLPQDEASPNKETNAVVIKNFVFSPETLIITKGNTVNWTNQDSIPHIISGNGLQSGTLSKGQSFSFIFNSAGTFDYICSLHPYMKGQIIVQ